jgi:hypothetical protein
MTSMDFWDQGIRGQDHIDLIGKKRFPTNNSTVQVALVYISY